jgi:FkbM family methyltransferase
MFRKILIILFSFKPFKRIVPSLIRKLAFSTNGNIVTIDDFKINLFLKSSIDREIFLKNEYEKDQLDFVKKELLNQNYDYFFDIGAYIGYYSLSLCKLVARTAAFEPNQLNFQRLSKNVEINNFNIICHNLGCSDYKNKLKLWYTDKNKRGGSSILQDKDKEINKYDRNKLIFEEIETDKLDNLYPLKNKKIFFKIDVERHELNVLKGASNILSNNQCYLQIEIFPHLQDKVLSFLNNNHFKLVHKINNDFYLKNF